MTSESQIADDEPVPLDEAVRVFLSRAGFTKHTLLAEIARGNLEHMRVGRKILVTRQMIKDMLERLKVPARPREPSQARPSGATPMSPALSDRMLKAKASLARNSAALKAGRVLQ